MPWVIAELRGTRVFARVDEQGKLLSTNGRVEIRYQRDDGKKYLAASRNLAIVDATPLPDDTCSSADPVQPKAPARKTGVAPQHTTDVIVYADGACSGNPGPAGLGVVILRGGKRIEIYDYLGEGTNNIAELTAVLRALEELEPGEPVTIHTDSSYTIGVAQKNWKAKANAELVARLRAALAAHGAAQLVYVPGHAGVALNERADQLARRAIAERRSGREERAEPT
jgi:ribonuclease HI